MAGGNEMANKLDAIKFTKKRTTGSHENSVEVSRHGLKMLPF